jgi:DNA invertase Pin-like site-specific DNA recombinase
MTKAFAYIRVSGPDQLKGDGPERQREAILAFAASNDIAIVEFFTEQVTGKNDGDTRIEWSRLLGQLNGVRTIIVEKLDRLARLLIVQEKILLDLASRDVVLLTADGQDSDDVDPARVMFRQFLGAIAQYERACIVSKLRSARDRKRRDTGRCEGAKRYGTLDDKSELKIYGYIGAEETTLELMKMLRCGGKTFDQIAEILNETDHPTRHGKKWYGTTINNILNARGREES